MTLFGLSKAGTRFLLGAVRGYPRLLHLSVFFGVRFFATSKKNTLAGMEYGQGRDGQACVDEALDGTRSRLTQRSS